VHAVDSEMMNDPDFGEITRGHVTHEVSANPTERVSKESKPSQQ